MIGRGYEQNRVDAVILAVCLDAFCLGQGMPDLAMLHNPSGINFLPFQKTANDLGLVHPLNGNLAEEQGLGQAALYCGNPHQDPR